MWPLLVVAHVPALVNTLVRVWTSRIWHRHDRAMPDDLPQTAGDWLRARLEELESPYRAYASSKHESHCDRRRRLIVLASDVSFKPDPVYWAIAAHELGHSRAPAWFRDLAVGAKVLRVVMVAAATAFACGGVLYDLLLARMLALLGFAVAIGLKAVTLVDEAFASITAQRELRAAGLDEPRLRAARSVLRWAYVTHLSTFVVELGLLAWWPLADLDLSRGPSTLTAIGTALAAVASVVIIVRVILPIWWLAWSPRLLVAFSLLAPVAPFVFLVLAWDTAVGIGAPWLVVLALVAAAGTVHVVLAVPFALPVHYLRKLVERFTRGVVKSTEFHTAWAAGFRQLGRDESHLAFKEPPPLPRPIELACAAVRLLPLPLVVAFWLA